MLCQSECVCVCVCVCGGGGGGGGGGGVTCMSKQTKVYIDVLPCNDFI